MQTAHDAGILSWVTSGRCDLVADIRFPREGSTEVDLSSIVADIVDKFDKEIGAHLHVGPHSPDTRIPGRGTLSRDALEVPPKGWDSQVESEKGWGERVEERIEETRGRWRRARGEASVKEVVVEEELEEAERTVSIDLDIRFKDLKAHVPVSVLSLGYLRVRDH